MTPEEQAVIREVIYIGEGRGYWDYSGNQYFQEVLVPKLRKMADLPEEP